MKEKIKILFLIDIADAHDFTGGAEMHVMDIIRHLNQEMFYPVCAANNRDYLESLTAADGSKIFTYFLKKGRGTIFSFFISIVHVIRQVRPHIVHTHKPYASLVGRIAGVLCGVPVVISTLHSTPSLRNPTKNSLAHSDLKNFLYRYGNAATANYCCSTNIAVSRRELEMSITQDKIVAEKLQLVYNGLFDFPHWNHRTRTRLNTMRLISVGRLHSEKGHMVTLRAMESILSTFPTATLTLVGDGPERTALERFAQTRLPRESVRFLSTVDRHEIPKILHGADLFVLSSHRESLPYAVIEAMASGLPVVASDVGGLSELIVPDQGGVLVPPDSPSALALAITRLLSNPERRQCMGVFNRERAATLFSGQRMIQTLEVLYRSFIT